MDHARGSDGLTPTRRAVLSALTTTVRQGHFLHHALAAALHADMAQLGLDGRNAAALERFVTANKQKFAEQGRVAGAGNDGPPIRETKTIARFALTESMHRPPQP